jgi:hypothetical protein
MSPIDAMYSDTSEPEPSDTPNATAFDTATHATAEDLLNTETANDFLEVNGRSYLTANRTANQSTGIGASWI